MFSKDIEPKCALCQFAQPIENSTDLNCEKKKGVVAYNHSCRKYKYDVFKRKVHPKKRLTEEFSVADFSID